MFFFEFLWRGVAFTRLPAQFFERNFKVRYVQGYCQEATVQIRLVGVSQVPDGQTVITFTPQEFHCVTTAIRDCLGEDLADRARLNPKSI